MILLVVVSFIFLTSGSNIREYNLQKLSNSAYMTDNAMGVSDASSGVICVAMCMQTAGCKTAYYNEREERCYLFQEFYYTNIHIAAGSNFYYAPVGFEATTAQARFYDGNTRMEWDTITYNRGNYFDGIGFSCPLTAYYRIKITLTYSGGTSMFCHVRIRPLLGTNHREVDYIGTEWGTHWQFDNVACTAGEYIFLYSSGHGIYARTLQIGSSFGVFLQSEQ